MRRKDESALQAAPIVNVHVPAVPFRAYNRFSLYVCDNFPCYLGSMLTANHRNTRTQTYRQG